MILKKLKKKKKKKTEERKSKIANLKRVEDLDWMDFSGPHHEILPMSWSQMNTLEDVSIWVFEIFGCLIN